MRIPIGGQPTNSCTLVWPRETGSWVLRPPFTRSSTYSVTKNGRTCPGGDVLWMGSDRDPFVLALSSCIGVDRFESKTFQDQTEITMFRRFLQSIKVSKVRWKTCLQKFLKLSIFIPKRFRKLNYIRWILFLKFIEKTVRTIRRIISVNFSI